MSVFLLNVNPLSGHQECAHVQPYSHKIQHQDDIMQEGLLYNGHRLKQLDVIGILQTPMDKFSFDIQCQIINKSSLVQVMAWHMISHYQNQWWPSALHLCVGGGGGGGGGGLVCTVLKLISTNKTDIISSAIDVFPDQEPLNRTDGGQHHGPQSIITSQLKLCQIITKFYNTFVSLFSLAKTLLQLSVTLCDALTPYGTLYWGPYWFR